MTSENEHFQARVGSTLNGKWTLERLLGVGGMAAVYGARHRVGHPAAIKILHPELARSSDLRARFEQEAHAMGKISHPGMVEVRDIDVAEDGAPFIVMELLDGESLKERLMRGPVPTDDMLRYADEALDILAAAHAMGVVHRDIKLDNLFIQRQGGIKLLDFGIARVREGVAKTAVGMRLGTLPYMPPEQVKGEQVDGRADLFALGAVMFRALGGRRVHDVKTESEMIIAMSSRPAPPLLTVASDLPPGVCMVVDCALAFDRARRYPDAATMQQDILAVRSGDTPPHASSMNEAHGPPNTRESLPPTVRPPRPGPATAVGLGPQVGNEAATQRGRALALPRSVRPPPPASGTAAATAFAGVDAPMSSTGVAPAGAPGSFAGAARAAPLGMPKTALIPEMHIAARSEETKVSAGAPLDATRVSAGGAIATPELAAFGIGVEEALPSGVAALSAATPTPTPAGALGPAGTLIGAPPASLVATAPKRDNAVIIGVVAASLLTLLLLIGLVVWATAGDEPVETASPDITSTQDDDPFGFDNVTTGDEDDPFDGGVPPGASTNKPGGDFPGLGLPQPKQTAPKPVAPQPKPGPPPGKGSSGKKKKHSDDD